MSSYVLNHMGIRRSRRFTFSTWVTAHSSNDFLFYYESTSSMIIALSRNLPLMHIILGKDVGKKRRQSDRYLNYFVWAKVPPHLDHPPGPQPFHLRNEHRSHHVSHPLIVFASPQRTRAPPEQTGFQVALAANKSGFRSRTDPARLQLWLQGSHMLCPNRWSLECKLRGVRTQIHQQQW